MQELYSGYRKMKICFTAMTLQKYFFTEWTNSPFKDKKQVADYKVYLRTVIKSSSNIQS
jgi:hypothetical protein